MEKGCATTPDLVRTRSVAAQGEGNSTDEFDWLHIDGRCQLARGMTVHVAIRMKDTPEYEQRRIKAAALHLFAELP